MNLFYGSGSYGSLYLRKGYVSPNMSRRSMHRDSTHSEVHSNSSVIVHQDTATGSRLNYSSDDASGKQLPVVYRLISLLETVCDAQA